MRGSHVSVLSNFHLSPQIRLFLLRWRYHAGMYLIPFYVNIIRSLMICCQLLIVVLATNSAEFGLTIAAIPVVLVLIAGCAYAVQREIKWSALYALPSVSLANLSPG
jgi:hypothetical protein